MAVILWALAAFSAALAGFASLGLAMDRHYEDSFGRGKDPGRWRRWMQAAGTAALGLSLATCLGLQGTSQGWVLWLGMLTAGAVVVVLVLSYAPRKAASVAGATGGIALLATLAGALLR